MYVNKSLLLRYLFVITTLILIHKTTSTSAELTFLGTSCTNYPKFSNGSMYQTNLKTLFRTFVSNATRNPSGFYQTIVGNPAIEAVYGHYLCRGDQNITSCHHCVTEATATDLPMICPNRKTAVIWYDECMVRYSNKSFFNYMEHSFPINYASVNNITGNSTEFMDMLRNMMNNKIAVRAAEGGSFKKFATDFSPSDCNTDSKTIYGLGQCTPDLSPSDCNTCLMLSTQLFRESLGGRVIVPSCVVHYAMHPFFNLSYLPLPPSPPPSLPPSSPPSLPLSPPPSSNPNKIKSVNSRPLRVVVAIIVALIVFFAALVSICIFLRKKKARKVDMVTNNVAIANQDLCAEFLHYDLSTLLNATNSFSNENKLGEGGFGSVYKGTLSDGILIAVKRLSARSSQGIQEFKTEVLVVAKLQHRNLVRLLGFCYTEKEKLLVYEYVPNKSLDNFIFDHEHRPLLDWQMRYNIIRGIARGLLYLHHDSQHRIIHRDLKAGNILLDEEMNPKISDFGTSRIFGVDQSLSNYTNRVVGTYGYMSPEYALQGQFSIKSDVYSFGVLVLEIISGKRVSNFDQSNDAEDLATHAWEHWEAGTPIQFVDPTIRDSCSDNNTEVMRCLQLGLLCVQQSVEDRPTMANAILTLESYSVTLPVPDQPDFFAGARVVDKSVPFSVNQDSDFSELEPR